MDWDRAIERNREALKRILAALAAMAGVAGLTSPPHPELVEGEGEDGPARRGKAEALAEPGEGYFSNGPTTLPRHLHRAVLRLLRPAESAARRLIIVIARGLVVTLPPPRPRKPKPEPLAPVLRSLGIAVVMSPADLARAAAAARAAASARRRRAARALSLPLVDPLCMPFRPRRTYVPAHAAPRILSFDGAAPRRLPPPPSPDDQVDAARLTRRLAALAAALDDLPGHARRFARWRAARDAAGAQNQKAFAAAAQNKEPRLAAAARDKSSSAGRIRRLWPLRPGRPPGHRPAQSRRPAHEVHEVLRDLQWFATQALEVPDTS